MSRGFNVFCAAMLALILLLVGSVLTITEWLPRLAGIWLPQNTAIAFDGRLGWRNGSLVLPGVHYRVGDCELVALTQVSLGWHHSRWEAEADKITLDSACLNQLTQSAPDTTAPRTLAQWQALLPHAHLVVHQLTLSPYPEWAGALDLAVSPARQTLHYQGKNLRLDARLSGRQLTLNRFSLSHPLLQQPLTLSGKLTLPEVPDTLPTSGHVAGTLALQQIPQPLILALDWQQQKGTFSVLAQHDQTPLLRLPWTLSADRLMIEQGQWRWPYAAQPLAGGLNLSLTHWRQGLSATVFQGRFNLLTQGRGGKGNVVLSFGPGRLDFVDSALPLQLTGESKLQDLQFYAAIPGIMRGSVLNPLVELQPGALLRMRGRLLSTLEVDEARWPLAGLKVSQAGVDGRLQAILRAHDPNMGRFTLHLDGKSQNFWPDNGRWAWRYWGNGYMAPLAAQWDVRGTGEWHDSTLTLATLSTGFDRLQYGMVDVNAPRLTITKPVVWQRDTQHPAFNGELQLVAQRTALSSGGYLPPSTLSLAVKGRDPARFLFNGSLSADAIGPLRVNGRWDGIRLRGQAWWPQQSLTAFQSLLSPDLKMRIQSGSLKAQVAFSAASDQGLEAGGHWVVKDGSVKMPDNEINGIDFSLPFRLKAHQWVFGARGPVSLRIKAINNQFAMANISADLQGSYPWSERQPLDLTNVSVDMLGGTLSMAHLGLPQHAAATLRLRGINLSELVTAINPKQIAMSGHINGELPLWVNHSQWLVKDGWIANEGSLTLRLDKDMADAITRNNVAAGAALDWLRYMEISRAWATLNLNTIGDLTMSAQVDGKSRFINRTQRVLLNYTHRENLFQLWRSLRFGDNLQSWVEDNATLPSQKEQKP
ncbi:YdbH family protein [Paramixta manurensis]|uniref:YdbH family protein n=1 Tax=Paramixta manurensis TaxID=2740817 RepID=A0A6M8UCC7_9GAMM|nr:YdbH family protein [Erwiniaceae bacterium PD-1]